MDAAARLEYLRTEKLGDCTRCGLHKLRTNIVFGAGSPEAEVMFVGAGPGGREDALGQPFVGTSGVILNNIIKHVGLTRESVYIADTVKCRPPMNRDPEREQVAACSPYLHGQIAIVRPNILVALGRFAGNMLSGQHLNLTDETLHGRLWTYRNEKLGLSIPVIVIHHPAYLHQKAESDAIIPLYRETISRLRTAIDSQRTLDLDIF